MGEIILNTCDGF